MPNSAQLVRQKSGNMNDVCAIWCKSLILYNAILYVCYSIRIVLVALFHFAGYMRCMGVWFVSSAYTPTLIGRW